MKVTYETKTVDFCYRNDKGGVAELGCSPHLHYHVEILYMLEGRTHAYIDSELYTVEDGDMLVVFPNKIHRFVDESKGNKYMLFIINPKLVPEFEELMISNTPDSPLIKNASSNLRLDSVTKIVAGCRDFPEEQKDALMKGYLLSFFAEFMSMLKLNSGRNDDNQAMKAVVLYCSQNFTKDLSLAMLEEELRLSKYYISHLFGDKLGIRFNDYINSLRISESCRLLKTTDMSITEISDAAGFGTLRTFNRAFIKQMKVSPSDFRRNNRSKFINVSVPHESIGENSYVSPEARRHKSKSDRALMKLVCYPFDSKGSAQNISGASAAVTYNDGSDYNSQPYND